ncbi:hypothetical protein [Yinghuangia seranimata]|uniref:hypothetical protein n=1 Tax=Yinghuangia seranimata TaxID=408067 RepID=UPI00248B670B|nr:hypothetical protein [Yinghuangia seranimata]MDI2127594.1 hypothetical protein [Yinghuangia seranimata]
MIANSLVPFTVLESEANVLALAGAGTSEYRVGDARIVCGAAAAVVIAEAHDDLAVSGVRNSRTFELIDTALDDSAGWPPMLVGLVLMFVRVPHGIVYLGQGQWRQWGNGYEGGFSAVLEIRPPVPGPVLDRVRPPHPPAPVPDDGWMDLVADDPQAALAEFVTGWHPTAQAAPALNLPGTTKPLIPQPLAHFHRLAADRPRILGVQNFIEPWEKLSPRPGELMQIAVENQGGWGWLVDPTEPDPAVWVHHDDVTPMEREPEPLSTWLLQFALAEAACGGPYGAFATQVPTPRVDDLARMLRRVPLRSRSWSGYPASFYVAPGLVVKVSGDQYISVVAAAKHRALLHPLAQAGIEWLKFDG